MKKRLFIFIVVLVIMLSTMQVYAGTYTVRSGDSLWRIAVKYQVGVSELISSNPQIKNPNLIYPGQVVNIPVITVKAQEDEVVQLVNKERVRRGLQVLKAHWEIARVARYKSQDMINKGYFDHYSPTFGSPFKMMESFQIKFSAAAENIARGQRTPTEVMNAWMNSTGHRNNILSPVYTHIGVGLAKDRNGVCYWTQMFTKSLY